MTPPVSPAAGLPPDEGAPAVPFSPEVLRKRSDFLAANTGRRAPMPGFVLLGRDRGDSRPPRVGFTCSKKVGDAVRRNRAKRRLRALAREVLAPRGRMGWDYVLIGRRDATVTLPYGDLAEQLGRALDRVHGS